MTQMEKHSKIFVAGHKGLVGSAIVRALRKAGFENVLERDRHQVDLENTASVDAFFAAEKPEFVFMAAAKVVCASVLIEPSDIAPVAKRLTISLAGST